MSKSTIITQKDLLQLVNAYNAKHSADPTNDEVYGARRGLIIIRSHVKNMPEISTEKLEEVGNIIIAHEGAKADEFEALGLDDTSLNSIEVIESIKRAISALKNQ